MCIRDSLVLGMLENNVYLISDGESTMVVDPSCKADVILEALGGRKVDAIVLTHRHFDHVGAARAPVSYTHLDVYKRQVRHGFTSLKKHTIKGE